jgi:hypothetical protein
MIGGAVEGAQFIVQVAVTLDDGTAVTGLVKANFGVRFFSEAASPYVGLDKGPASILQFVEAPQIYGSLVQGPTPYYSMLIAGVGGVAHLALTVMEPGIVVIPPGGHFVPTAQGFAVVPIIAPPQISAPVG